MKGKLLAVAAVALLLSSAGLMAQVRSARPNDVTVEVGGRCIIYSVSYQRMIGRQFALDVGASILSADDLGQTDLFLTGGGRYYFWKGGLSPYLGAGIVYVSGSSDAGFFENESSHLYGYATPGLEFRAPGGFVVRGGAYILMGDFGVHLWPALSLGYAF